ncbi:MAG: GGDEF domain-containing protein [Burkholderiales bacterium]
MKNFSWLPKDDPKQVIRINRVMLACSYAVLYLISLALFYWQGKVPASILLHAAIIVVVLIVGFYLVFRFNFNKKFADQSLTAFQLLTSIITMQYVIYYAPETRVVYVVFLLISLMFGMLRLGTRELLVLGALALLGYLGLSVLRFLSDGDTALLRMDALVWFTLAITLPSFILMGGRIRKLRSDLREASYRLEDTRVLTLRDELTGVFNRRYITSAMQNEKVRCDLGGGPFCICIMDIDHFKRVNDTAGHLAGDEVLKTFAQNIQMELRDADTFGRYGGEEFVQILANTSLEGGLIHAERTRHQVEKIRFPQLGGDLGITVSIGVAQYEKGEPVLHTFARADDALYQAKEAGRNKVTWEKFAGRSKPQLQDKGRKNAAINERKAAI